jgi:hypothetical protein
MRRQSQLVVLCAFFLFTAVQVSEARQTVPRLVTFGGTLLNHIGQPLTGPVGITFAIYRDQNGGAAIWMENQNLELDAHGGYIALLGSTRPEGLPIQLFSSGESRWLGVQAQVPGEPEQPRVLLVSVPYALKAADADTIGGRPASAFVLAPQVSVSGDTVTVPSPNIQALASGAAVTGSGTTGNLLKWTDGTNSVVGDSAMVEKNGNVGFGTTDPITPLDIAYPFPKTDTGLRIAANLARSNDAVNPFALVAGAVGAPTLTNRLGVLQTQDANLANGGNLGLQPFGGYVGIGTLNPIVPLDVSYGFPKTDPNLRIGTNLARSSDAVNPFALVAGAVGAPTLANRLAVLQTQDANLANGGNLGIQPFGGNVGVGTANPAATLDVNGMAKAVSFSGDGSALTNLNANNVAGTLANSRTTATSSNTANSIVSRDASGNFAAGAITAVSLSGNGAALTNVNASTVNGVQASSLQTRGITYLGGCDTCSLLADTDDQPMIYVNVVGPMTINSVICYSDAGTPTINLHRGGSANNVLSNNLQCSTSPTPGISFTNGEGVLNLNDSLDFVMVSAGMPQVTHRVTVVIKTTLN